jgi:hypothetical protein
MMKAFMLTFDVFHEINIHPKIVQCNSTGYLTFDAFDDYFVSTTK